MISVLSRRACQLSIVLLLKCVTLPELVEKRGSLIRNRE
jgi:hypothetical protein